MRKSSLFFVIATILVFCVAVCFAAQEYKMQKLIDQATAIISEFKEMPEQSIPEDVLKNCKGLAVLSVLKGGFILGVSGGSGIVIAKDASGTWTAPSAIGTGGASFGFQAGGQETDYVLVLNTEAAVKALSQNNCTLGADASVSAGPVGRTASGDLTVASAIFSYSRSKGLFAGVSLEGAVIAEENGVNSAYYGKPVTAEELLSGAVPPPAGASNLYNALSPYGAVKAEAVK